MLPLSFAAADEEAIIKKIGGSQEIRRHLEDLGFIVGSVVTPVAVRDGNVIVKVKESRIAISKELAQKIYV
ncbi:MAG: ferrous iron transport protein A [Clostridia bacterium]|nr:ferrous iron transport protein A [Clostridia bacterium]MCR5693449.1 ferrous iron transport protein A [Clostridia bacterium]